MAEPDDQPLEDWQFPYRLLRQKNKFFKTKNAEVLLNPVVEFEEDSDDLTQKKACKQALIGAVEIVKQSLDDMVYKTKRSLISYKKVQNQEVKLQIESAFKDKDMDSNLSFGGRSQI